MNDFVGINRITISTPHQRIHEGRFFHSSYLVPNASKISDGDSVDLILEIGSKSAHAIITVDIGGDVEFHLFEDVTTDTNGVELPRYNNNRSSIEVSEAIMYVTPTGLTGGTELGQGIFIAGGSGGSAGGGTQTPDHELMFKPSTKYHIQVISRASSTQQISIELGWYE